MNYQETKKALRDYIVAGIPFVTVQSVDRHRPERMVREIAQENGFDMFLYTDARQVVHLGPEARMPVDVHSDPLPYLNDLFQKSQNCIFVLGDTHKIDVDGAYTRELLSAGVSGQRKRETPSLPLPLNLCGSACLVSGCACTLICPTIANVVRLWTTSARATPETCHGTTMIASAWQRSCAVWRKRRL